MWRNSNNSPRSLKTNINSGRWRLAVAIVFLLAGSLIYKLFSLQIEKSDFYVAMASNQQRSSSKLSPQRGNIYFTGDVGGKETLYPAATNKESQSIIATTTRDNLIAVYLKHFDKPGDVYDSLDNRRVDDQEILKLYA